MMNADPMKDALKRRKMQGLDITISIDPAGEKETDLAPAGEAPPEAGEAPLEKAMAAQEQDPDQDDMGMLEELTGGMSDYDKEQAMEPGKKPLSLGERARMDAVAKLKQGK